MILIKCLKVKVGIKFGVESVIFYIVIFGYNLKVGIFFNGNGFGKNIYFLVFIYVMKGEDEVVLVWFFSERV